MDKREIMRRAAELAGQEGISLGAFVLFCVAFYLEWFYGASAGAVSVRYARATPALAPEGQLEQAADLLDELPAGWRDRP